MKKKEYERPAMLVVELKQQQQLLQSSVTTTIDETPWVEEEIPMP